jgi:hypothetical protein
MSSHYSEIQGKNRILENRKREISAEPYLRAVRFPASLRLDKNVKSEAVLIKRKPPIYKTKVQKTIGKKVALSTCGIADVGH